MNQSINVRPANLADLDELAGLFNAYRVFYRQAPDLEGARQFLYERFVHRESVIFLAVSSSSGQAAGFTQLYPSFSSVSMRRIWILNDLYVNEAFRRQGAGRALMEAARKYAGQTGAKGLALSTGLDNFSAQRLYEQSGYERESEFYHYFLSI